MNRRAAWLLVCLALVGLAATPACQDKPPQRTTGPVRVVATLLPLAGLARPLVPDTSTIEVIIPPSRSEHGYELTARDVAALAQADVVLYVGLGLEPQVEAFLKKNPSPTRREVCFADAVGIKAEAEDPDHDHAEGEHHHAGPDPHLWLDPELCIKLIPALAQAIETAAGKGATGDRAEKLIAQIKAFDAESQAKLKPCVGQPLVTHHSAWERFAKHYGLMIAAVIKPVESVEENNKAMDAAIDAIRKQGARAIFVEPQFNDKTARRIAEATGVRVGILDPLGDGDWFKMMRANTDAIAKALAR